MTEICQIDNTQNRYLIDPTAFFAALILAPLLVALLGFWIVLIPVVAVILGGLPYLLVGGPLLANALRKNKPTFRVFSRVGLLANVATPFLVFLFYMINSPPEAALNAAVIYFGFGLIFAPLWSGMFAVLYRKFRLELYSRPL